MKQCYHFFLFLITLIGSSTVYGQASMGFENQTTTQNCQSTVCNYIDPISAAAAHELMNAGGIPVNSPTSPGVLGFRTFFQPTRTGTSATGLNDGDFFGYAENATVNFNVGQNATEGTQAFIAEDTDGEITLEFSVVSLAGVGAGTFSMDYIVDGTFEASAGADDRLYVELEVTGCPAATTVVLLDAKGDPTGGATDLDAIPDATWNTLNQDLAPYTNCNVQLSIIMDTNSASEEMAFDNIVFSAGVTLPVELLELTAIAREKTVELAWATATETENRGFSIERSMDATNFQPVGWVDGNGNSGEQINYTFADQTITAGQQYYYRLRQEDYDGTYAFSPIVRVESAGAPENITGRVFPNPTQSGLTNLELYAERAAVWEIAILDLNGRQITSNPQAVTEGYNLLPVNLQDYPVGTYLIRVTGQGATEIKRIIR